MLMGLAVLLAALLAGGGCTFISVKDSSGNPIAGAKGVLLKTTEIPGDADWKELGSTASISGLDGNMITLWYYFSKPKLIAIVKDGYNTTTVPFTREWGRSVTMLRPGEKLTFEKPQTQDASTQPESPADVQTGAAVVPETPGADGLTDAPVEP